MAGNIAVATAAVADVTKPEERSRGMGLIGMAFGGAWGPNRYERVGWIPLRRAMRTMDEYDARHPPPDEVIRWSEHRAARQRLPVPDPCMHLAFETGT